MKHVCFKCLVMAWWMTLLSVAADPVKDLPRGHLFLSEDFESETVTQRWHGPLNFQTGPASAHALSVRRDIAEGAAMATLDLPAGDMLGQTVYCTAMVKGEHISAKPKPWNGVKFMLRIDSPQESQWPAASFEGEAFDWQQATFAARIPTNATKVTLFLGLESVTGMAAFDDVKVFVGKARAPITAWVRPATPYKGHQESRLRGTMIGSSATDGDLKVLGQEWKANLIRWQLIHLKQAGPRVTMQDFNVWLDTELKKLDAALVSCERYGLRVVVDLHSPPGGKATAGGYSGSDSGLFHSQEAQDTFVKAWETMARRYKTNAVIWGYDLANEPVEDFVSTDCEDWQQLAERTARAINAIDTSKAIIVEPADWGSPGSLANLRPINLPNVVYSVHMYLPMEFTHQTLYGNPGGVVYPGQIAGVYWNKDQLRKALEPVIAFQRQYGVHIYMGEFSAIRWAPGQSSCAYLKDLIDIFEEQGWDWSYHAYREWQGWSVEYDENQSNQRPSTAPTERQKLLRSWFDKNSKALTPP